MTMRRASPERASPEPLSSRLIARPASSLPTGRRDARTHTTAQVLELGEFHTDPHPGNLIVRPDGRLGLLDWGQVSNDMAHKDLSS